MGESLLASLIERRDATWREAKALLDTVERSASQTFTPAQESRWQTLEADLNVLDERIRQHRAETDRSDRIDRNMRVNPPVTSRSDSKMNEELRAFALGESGRSIDIDLSSIERRFNPDSGKWETRDLTVGSATAGGNTVPTSFSRTLVEHMIESSAIRQTNVTLFNTASGEDLQVPKTTAHPTAAIVAEGAAIGESDPAFGLVTLEAYKYGFITQVSRELVEDTGVNLEAYLARAGGRAIGNGCGAHFITGTGTSQPRGVVTAATVGVTGGTGVDGAFTADNLIDLYFSVIPEYRERGYWMMSSAAWGDARKLKDSNNNYLIGPLGTTGDKSLLGRPVVIDTNVAAPGLSAKSVVFGDFAAYAIRDVNTVRIERSDDYAFNTDLVTFRFLFRTDGDLIDETGAIKVFQGAAT